MQPTSGTLHPCAESGQTALLISGMGEGERVGMSEREEQGLVPFVHLHLQDSRAGEQLELSANSPSSVNRATTSTKGLVLLKRGVVGEQARVKTKTARDPPPRVGAFTRLAQACGGAGSHDP